MIQLNEGVHLDCISTKKFKTIHVHMYFKQELTSKTLAEFALLSRLLDLSTEKYPSQTSLNRALSNLYGASFSTHSFRQGNQAILQFEFVFPNSNYIKQAAGLAEKNLDFIKQVLFHPYASGGCFDRASFERQQANLLDEWEAIADDKQAYARLRLNELYYPDAKYQYPPFGRPEDLKQITPASLFQSFQNVIKNNDLSILIIGDLDQDQTTKAMEDLAFEGRKSTLQVEDIFYQPQLKEGVQELEEQQAVKQAKLNLAYDSGIYYLQDHYFAGLIFNGLFGGFPHSKLFLNVREKESLAYYASSSLSAWTAKLTVQTGIDASNQVKTKQIIADQLKALQDGEFSLDELDQTKKALSNGRLQVEDSPCASLKRILNEELAINRTLALEEWLAKLNQVEKEDIIQVAQSTQLKASYFLSGGMN